MRLSEYKFLYEKLVGPRQREVFRAAYELGVPFNHISVGQYCAAEGSDIEHGRIDAVFAWMRQHGMIKRVGGGITDYNPPLYDLTGEFREAK
jgi:hypothetical protein